MQPLWFSERSNLRRCVGPVQANAGFDLHRIAVPIRKGWAAFE